MNDQDADGFNRKVPLAVTTNFDNDLERVLRGAHVSHHILFPVHSLRSVSGDHADDLAPLSGEDEADALAAEIFQSHVVYPFTSRSRFPLMRRNRPGVSPCFGPVSCRPVRETGLGSVAVPEPTSAGSRPPS